MSIELSYRKGKLDGIFFLGAIDSVVRNHRDFIGPDGKPSGYVTLEFFDKDAESVTVYLQEEAVEQFAGQVASVVGDVVLEQSP